ncbi:MAG: GNAT family N-acetyltransferase [Lachnospiraceae bacterium]|nr:GNAT family N-acetyltransferase [Lachnospiraceae bacterium]
MEGNLIRLGTIDDDGSASGALYARVYESFADLMSLYVLPKYRGKGCGRALMEDFENTLKDLDITSISGEYPEGDVLDRFFMSAGYELFPGKNIYQTTVGDLFRSPLFRKIETKKRKKGYGYISKLSVADKKVFGKIVNNVEYDPDWSTARIDNGKYTSCLLCNTGENSINIIWTNSVDLSPEDFRQHTALLIDKIKDEMSDRTDTVINMTFERKEVSDYVTKVFGGKEHLRNTGRYIEAIKLL